jgi:hypothetical protein
VRRSPAETPRDAGALLVACLLADGDAVADERLTRLPEREWRRLPAAARYHKVTPAAYIGLRRSRVAPQAVVCELRAGYDASLRHHLLVWQVLRDATARFDAAGIEHVVFKGPVLAETVYPRPDLRDYVDLDLLVRRNRFDRALGALEEAGGTLIEQNWELVLHLLKGELNLAMPTGVVVDLHWSLLYDDTYRHSFADYDEDFIDRAMTACVRGERVSVPDPADQLLHLCVHGCLAGCHRLAWLQDIRLAATRTPIDWPDFWQRAADRRLTLAAVVALDHVERCFGLNLPVVGDRALWLRITRRLDAVRPASSWHGGWASGHLLPAATRSTTRASIGALGTGLRSAASELVHDPSHPWRASWSRPRGPQTPHEMFVPVGGDPAREAFLHAVTHPRGRAGA